MAESDIQSEQPDDRRRHDDDRPRRRRRDDEDDVDVRMPQQSDAASTLIPYKNPKALMAYYCGVFGLIPCLGAILGPIALILGILGLRYAKEHPTAKGTGHAIAGIVLGILEVAANCGGILFIVISGIAGSSR